MNLIHIMKQIAYLKAYWVKALVALLISFYFSCDGSGQQSELPDQYGGVHGRFAQSINGLAVFTEMLKQSGSDVRTVRSLNDTIDEADLLIWVPDRMDAPTYDEVQLLNSRYQFNNWTRVLFVGRDYDSSISYWEKVIDQLPESQKFQAEQHVENLRARWSFGRGTGVFYENIWFRYDLLDRWIPATQLSGELANGVDGSKSDLVLTGKSSFQSNYVMEVLLYVNDEPFVFVLQPRSRDVSAAEVVIVTNGSLLLNLPLVNHENRRLVQNLIDYLDPGRVAIFSSGGQTISESADSDEKLFWKWMSVPPFNWIIPHLIFFGILYCFCYFPIFGRPRQLPPANVSEFKTHIEAVGQMLEQTKDRQFARNAIQHYRQISGHHPTT